MNKKILTIVEIVFALVFVIIMVMIFSQIYNFGNTINLNLENMQETINDAGLVQYNNKTISGDTVMSTINKMKETRNGLSMSYAVCNGSGSAIQGTQGNWKFYGHQALQFEANQAASNNTLTIFDASGNKIVGIGMGKSQAEYIKYDTNLKPTEIGYISPVQIYNSYLAFNKNGVLVGIVFIPK